MLEAVEVIRGFLTVRGLVSLHSVLFKGKLYFKISETQPRKKKIKITIILPSREKHSIWASSMSVFPSYISLLFNQQTFIKYLVWDKPTSQGQEQAGSC